MFLDTLARYCDYEYDVTTKKYTVLEVYKYPKSLYDSKIHRGIYQYLAPLILYEVLFGEGYKDRKAVITSMDLAQVVSMVNSNYTKMKYNQDSVVIDTDFDANILSEYFNKADNRIDDYIRRCIKYLAAMNCVIYNEVHMIGIMPKTAEIENGHIIVEQAKGYNLIQIFSEVMSGLKNSKLNSWSLFFRVVRLDVLFISTIRTGIVLDQRLDMLISCVLMASSELQLFSGL